MKQEFSKPVVAVDESFLLSDRRPDSLTNSIPGSAVCRRVGLYCRAAYAGGAVESLLLVSKPYRERRSYATCRKLWPEVEVVCASEPLELDDHIKSIGDEKLVSDLCGPGSTAASSLSDGDSVPKAFDHDREQW